MSLDISPSRYGTVSWRAVGVTGDGPDADTLPEGTAPAGAVWFLPNVSSIPVANGLPVPFTALPARVECALDADGYLVRAGNRNVDLLAGDWSWTASFQLTVDGSPVDFPDFSFDLLPGTAVDLTTVIPVESHTGESLTRGVDGKDGIDGAPGVDGKDGIDGAPGVDGKDGIDGTNGRDGVDGKDGIDGAPGVDGTNGRDGVDGKDGIDGAPGVDGTNGRDGVDGKDGLSAYELAVQAGFDGSEEMWRNSFWGPKGESAYDLAVKDGFPGTYEEWNASLHGKDGLDAYEIALLEGTTTAPTRLEWLQELNASSGGAAPKPALQQIFDSPVFYEVHVPEGAVRARMTAIGAGGGGGAGAKDLDGTTRGGGGSGGGGGGYSSMEFTLPQEFMGATISVQVGERGLGATSWDESTGDGRQGLNGTGTYITGPGNVGVLLATEGGGGGYGGNANGTPQPVPPPWIPVQAAGGGGWYFGGRGGYGQSTENTTVAAPSLSFNPGPGGGGGGTVGGNPYDNGGSPSGRPEAGSTPWLAIGGYGGQGGSALNPMYMQIETGPHNNGAPGTGYGAGGGGGAGGGKHQDGFDSASEAGTGGDGSNGGAEIVWYFS
jgi:hypothetical protein